jgi:hypothetical protein
VTAVPALEPAQVLHQSQNRGPKLVEHEDGLFGHPKGDVLRGRHGGGAGEGDLLAEAQLDVSRTWRQIDEQIVQLAPLNPAEELVHHLGKHGPPPDDRFSFGYKKAHPNDLHAVTQGRNDLSIFLV